mmetsp:Transcript_62327/g.140966  ORF Transcript_62327/g.140966 Transcript_62327/m.140966 type:complete len:226 (+) Transcript_62327:716-1393(+)
MPPPDGARCVRSPGPGVKCTRKWGSHLRGSTRTLVKALDVKFVCLTVTRACDPRYSCLYRISVLAFLKMTPGASLVASAAKSAGMVANTSGSIPSGSLRLMRPSSSDSEPKAGGEGRAGRATTGCGGATTGGATTGGAATGEAPRRSNKPCSAAGSGVCSSSSLSLSCACASSPSSKSSSRASLVGAAGCGKANSAAAGASLRDPSGLTSSTSRRKCIRPINFSM